MRCAFAVEGRPVPQGSMTASYNRKKGVSHVHHTQGTAIALWRASIREQARLTGAYESALPIRLSVEFGMPRPQKHLSLWGGRYVVKHAYLNARPAAVPDLDKLVRNVLDALTLVCYHDDKQVVEIRASKVYGNVTTIEVTDEIDPLTLGLGEDRTASVDTG